MELTEIMYHPPDTGSRAPDEYEFLELKNTGDRILDLTGVMIDAGVTFIFPEGAVFKPGTFIVLVANEAAFHEKYPEVAVFGEYRGKLSNSGDTVELRDSAGEIVWSVSYSDTSPWPENADGWILPPEGIRTIPRGGGRVSTSTDHPARTTNRFRRLPRGSSLSRKT